MRYLGTPLLATFLLVGCGGPQVDRATQLGELAQAINRPVSSPDESQQNSRVVETTLETEVLMDMTRVEVEEAIGRGDPCSRHPRCADQAFESDDWFYTVGQMGEGRAGVLPILIVGFDRSGRVSKVWNLRTH